VLDPRDVGKRVVIRRIVPPAEPEPAEAPPGRASGETAVQDNRPIFSDVLGELVEWTESKLTVRTRSGPVEIPLGDIARAKTVPAQRRLSATEALELAAAKGWPAADSARLGSWWLRATEGWTMRGNSALPIGDPDRPLGEAIDAVAAWYRERGLPPTIVVPLPLRLGLDAELERRGWERRPTTQVMTAPLDALRLARRPEPVTLDRSPSPAWLAVAAARKGFLPDVALGVLTGVPEVRFATVYGPERAPSATARGVVTDGRWLGLSLIETAEPVRRQGFAQHVLGALVDWARSLGATDAYLQVEQRNTGAVALYERLGFTVHHTYAPRVQPAGG
jgi:GNAT superfamily N-acetyltransferase